MTTMDKWTLVEQIAGYWLWKYEDTDGQTVYNCTITHKPPTTEAGYYSYAYLLKVKGLMKGDTVGSLLSEWAIRTMGK